MNGCIDDESPRVRRRLLLPAAAALAACLWASPLPAQEWKTYESDAFGFSMLVPSDASVKEKEWEGGWGGLTVRHEGVTLWGLAKLGTKYSAEEIEAYGVRVTGIPAASWKVVDKGQGDSGWIWYRTVEAVSGGVLVFGGYGVGPKGSYLLVMKTTTADYEKYRSDYRTWYDSVRLK